MVNYIFFYSFLCYYKFPRYFLFVGVILCYLSFNLRYFLNFSVYLTVGLFRLGKIENVFKHCTFSNYILLF